MALPTEPGAYLDAGGDVWILSRNGMWIDCQGDKPPSMSDEAQAWLISNGPYTPMPRGVTFKKEFRVRNEAQDFVTDGYSLFEEAQLWIENDNEYVEERTTIEVPWTKVEDEETPDEEE